MAYAKTLKGLVPQSWKTAFWRMMPDRMVIRRNHYRRFGIYPDLDNPKTLTEKIQWLKLYGRTPLHTVCSDKIAVRSYVAEQVGPEILIPKILTTYDVSNITPERITAQKFVVKANHDCGTVIICRDRKSFDWVDCRSQLGAALKRRFYMAQRERQYQDIRPGILVEELIETFDGGEPDDYKLVCMNGRVVFIQVDLNRNSGHKRAIYDRDWQRIPYMIEIVPGIPTPYPREMRRPPNYDRMVEIAETLARDFVFVRVDLYNVEGRIYFGEITLTPGAGFYRFEPPEIDLAYGQKLDLSEVRR